MTITQARRRYAHGTNARYHLARCRCTPCKDASRAYVLKLRRTPSMHLIDAAPVTAHIRFLQSQGMSVKLIAAAARVTSSVTARFVDAYRTIKRTRRSTMKKFLSVKPCPPDNALVNADATRILVERIVALGYTRGWIAQQIGLKQCQNLPIGRSRYVRLRNARRMHTLYLTIRRRHRSLPRIPHTFRPGEIVPTTKRGRPSRVRIELTPETQRKLYAHGTTERYRLLGCRCKRCLKAFQDHEEALRSQVAAPYVLRKYRHGFRVRNLRNLTTAFRNRSRAAAKAVRDQLNGDDRYYGDNLFVDCGPVRRHLIALIDAGIPIPRIAHVSGFAQGELSNIRRGIRRQLRRKNASRLLNVSFSIASHADRLPIASIRKAIEHLVAVGFATRWLESVLELPSNSLTTYRLAHTSRLARWQAIAVLDLYAAVSERNILLRHLDAVLTRQTPSPTPRKAAA